MVIIIVWDVLWKIYNMLIVLDYDKYNLGLFFVEILIVIYNKVYIVFIFLRKCYFLEIILCGMRKICFASYKGVEV